MWWPPPGYGPPTPKRVVGTLLLLRLVPVGIIALAVASVVFISLAGSLLGGCTDGPATGGRGGPIHTEAAPSRQVVTIDHVRDGDTFTVRELDTAVRMIGVDTPETVDPRRPPGCYGPEASAFTKAALRPGLTVTLVYEREPDPAGRIDRFGRHLAYVYLTDGTFWNLELVERGYARARRYPPNDDHAAELAAAQRAAKAARRGLWGACARSG